MRLVIFSVWSGSAPEADPVRSRGTTNHAVAAPAATNTTAAAPASIQRRLRRGTADEAPAAVPTAPLSDVPEIGSVSHWSAISRSSIATSLID